MKLAKTPFPDSYPDRIRICGVIPKIKYDSIHQEFILLRDHENKKYKPCGITLRFGHKNHSFLFEKKTEDYIFQLKQKLWRIQDFQKNQIFNRVQIEKILDHEREMDKDRGSVAPYFRAVTWSFLAKLNVFPARMNLRNRVIDVSIKDEILMFNVTVAWSPELKRDGFHVVTKKSYDNFIGKYSMRHTDKIGVFSIDDKQFYSGKKNQYKILLEK